MGIRKKIAVVALAAVLGLSVAAHAASPAVGEVAPDLGGATWVMNAPAVDSVEALRGEVVFVERWGVKCPPCVALIPHIQQLQDEYGERGLHIFTIESQNHSADDIRKMITSRGGRTYPVAAGGANNYRGDGTIPVAWLIGVDGKVIWQGNPSSGRTQLDSLIKSEVAKVRFPGLGKNDVDKDVVKAAVKFVQKDYAGARNEARKVADDERASEAAKADAAHVLARVDEIAASALGGAQAAETEGRFHDAQDVYTELKRWFKREPEGEQAAERLKAMKKDKAIKREIAAARSLEKLLAALEGKPAEVRNAQLERFARGKKVEGTWAAREAEAQKAN